MLKTSIELYKRGRGEEMLANLNRILADGCPSALSMLGTVYETGCGVVEISPENAVRYYLRSIEALDDVNSHLGVSRIYLENPILDPGRDLVRYHLELLASNDIVGGVYGLGLLHQHGVGIPQDHEVALKYFERAANLGHLGAKVALFQMKGAKGVLGLIKVAWTVLQFKILERMRPSDPRLGLL